MDLTQIRYFVTLADTLNFTRAAEHCNVSQPALTKSIQRLEDELGGRLILRERALTQLTELGRTMLPLLQRTLDAAEQVRAQAALVQRGEGTAPLRLGIAPTVPLEALMPLLREVGARVSGLALELRHAPGPELAESVLAGELDAALLPEMSELPDRLNRWPLYAERIAVALPEAHPLAALGEVPASALDGLAVLDRADGDGSSPAVALGRLQDLARLRPDIRHRGESEQQVGMMVAAGLGIALVSERNFLPHGAVLRPLIDPEVQHPVVLAVAAGRPMNRAVSAFTKLARAVSWAV